MIHVHLDPLGGLAGDMFAAALMAAFPAQESRVADAVGRAVAVRCLLLPHHDGVLDGMRFRVERPDGRAADAPEPEGVRKRGSSGHAEHHHRHDHGHDHDHNHGHDHDHDPGHDPGPDPGPNPGPNPGHGSGSSHAHRAWREIRAHLLGCGLEPAVSAHAVGIFAVLAEAEGRVHGVPADAATFHEVGAADSIADIVAASVLIEGIGAGSWSVSALPLGSGRIRTAHGIMPVPAPATALLLDGFEVVDDGIAGERVTPTGAAIVRYLRDTGRLGARPSGRLGASGIGFGTRVLPGTSNCVRALVIEPSMSTSTPGGTPGGTPGSHRTLGVIAFEVDDQSGEDLAAGLDRIRRTEGVHDVVQMAAIGKKGRMAVHVQVLAAPDALDAVTAACFSETTTIGLRTHLVQGQALRRRIARTVVDGAAVDVKLAQRPEGTTAKAEADHLLDHPGQARRQLLRRQAEAVALALDGETGT